MRPSPYEDVRHYGTARMDRRAQIHGF
jgi:hypothetical protein